MLELVFTVCSIVTGARCHDVTLTFEQPQGFVLAYACGMTGQSEMAKWKESHPNWSIGSWRCGPAGEYAKI